MTAKPVPENMSFEDALAELEDIVGNLEGGKAALDDSIKSYERGMLLKQHCEKKLSAAQEKIEKITIGPDDSVGTEPFDSE